MAGDLNDLFDLGYAVPLLKGETGITWKYHDEQYSLPSNAVKLRDIEGVPFRVAHISDVRQAIGEALRATV